uniref:MFS transporter n=1 Tax=Enterocloster sp. TaxID=2719315 RepID=UPI0038908FB9
MKQTMNETKPSGWQRRTILFLTSQCITLFGSTLVQMAVVWYATMETASGAWVAAFTVCSYLPQFLISFSGGVWADRYSRKLLIAGADALTALATLAMLLAVPHITSKPFFLGGLLLMSVIRSLGAGIQTPAVNAVIPQLVPEEHLMRCNGINAAMQSAVQFAAPAAAGAIFTVSTLDTTLMIDIVTAILGIGLLSCLSIPSCKSQGQCSSFIQDMKAGVNYAFSHRTIGRLLILYGLFTFLCVPAGFLAGLFVRRSFGNTYWYLTAVEVIGFGGMILGGILMSLKNNGQSKTRLLSWGLFSFGAFAVGMGLSAYFIPYLIMMFFYGIALTVVQTSITTLIQKHTDVSMQGRVFGLLGTMYSGFLPLGMALFGPMADAFPLSWIMVGSGGDCPGLNATIRGVAKALYARMGENVQIVGILNGYHGLIT